MGCEYSRQFLPTLKEVEQAMGARAGVILTRIDDGLAITMVVPVCRMNWLSHTR